MAASLGAGSLHRCDVAVLGGGLTGLLTACALLESACGLRLIVTDRRALDLDRGDDEDDQVVFLTPDSVSFLDRLGLWEGLSASAAPVLGMHLALGVHPGSSAVRRLSFDAEDRGGEALGMIVETRLLRRALCERWLSFSAEARVHAPAEPTGDDDDGVRDAGGPIVLSFADGSRIEAELAVMATGAEAEAPGIRRVERSYGQAALTARISHEARHCDCAAQTFHADGPLALLPLKGRRSALIWTQPRSRAEATASLDVEDFRAVLQERCGDFLGVISHVTPPRLRDLKLVLSPVLVRGRRLLIGDGAHGVHPLAGQGLNIALRDIAALAQMVAEARRLGLSCGDPGLSAAYERRRRGDGIAFGIFGDALNALFAMRFPPARMALALGMGAIDRLPFLRRLAVDIASNGVQAMLERSPAARER